MMKVSMITRCITVVLFVTGVPSVHAATSWMEARNDAMGGTGVASSHYGTAALSNPALLTRFGPTDDFSLVLPSVGAQVSDPDKAVDTADDVKDLWNRFDSAIDSQSGVSGSAAALKNKLNDLKNAHADGQADASVIATVPNRTLPFAIVAKSWGTVSVDSKVTDHDLQYLDKVAEGAIPPSLVDKDALTSRAFGRAAVITDVGVAMAHQFETAGQKWSLGITPKYQRIDLFNYNVSVRDFDKSDIHSSDYRNTKTGFNADLGLATDLTDSWTLGLAVLNVIPRSVETKPVNGSTGTFKVKPQATAGAAWHSGFITTELDVNLTEASRFDTDKKRQFASAGIELNAWSWMQVRAGYRQNIISNDGSAFTAGLGFSPFDVVHLDITGIAGTDRTYGAVAQMQFTF
ncbi:conjugal transfer protein TraF [Salmonella enterica subsp. enterica serovar Typhimurium]|nr:conjugal transfer protein TraF [Salmonella enterica subsp. enterica serovar Typhimurium]EIF3374629.1 conjugal transfer protein TraF [Salmonella enterica subsp. enterica serovar Typhimurium]EII7208648.1 conjugal transfer protein TraF [Salmonella enterica subsp. enterica serovar Typhimurium]EIP0078573.1 conjugal transfer protein TraF [Salmonella enterica subsp. enterica serovar Typhimurium]EIW9447321.1 conjugal transfer protein TraF [Salmonella enterica subsp. enterica serovar Typhimurium]